MNGLGDSYGILMRSENFEPLLNSPVSGEGKQVGEHAHPGDESPVKGREKPNRGKKKYSGNGRYSDFYVINLASFTFPHMIIMDFNSM